MGGDGLFTAYNDEPNWHKAHNLLMPAFIQAAMRRYHPVMLDVAAELTAHRDARAGMDTVDVSADTTRVTLETIGRCATGYSFGCFRTETMHPFVEHMVEGLRGSDRLGVFRSTFLPRFIANYYERKVHRHAAHMHGIADEIIAARRKEGPGRHDDLLEIMLASDLDAANIRYQLINFLVAGHETTSGALSFALYFLSRHPDVFARARAEVDQVWGADERPEFEQIARLRYVRRVLDQSLRLQPTVPGYYRPPAKTPCCRQVPDAQGRVGGRHGRRCTATRAGGPIPTSSTRTGLHPSRSRPARSVCTNRSAPAKGHVSGGNSRCMRRC